LFVSCNFEREAKRCPHGFASQDPLNQSNLLTTPDVQHELATAAGTTFFRKQRADGPWMPGLTNVHARQPRVVRQSSPQAPELPLRAMLRKSLPGRSVFWRGPSCAEAVPAIPEKAKTNADAIIRLRRHMATSCGNFLGLQFKRFPIATGYELAHMLAAIDETAAEGEMRLAHPRHFTRRRRSLFGFNCQTARGYASAFSRLKCARALRNFRPPLKTKGAGKAGCTLHPRSRVPCVEEWRTRAYRSSGGIPAFPARWVTAYFVLSPVNGSFATVAPERLASHELDASTAASEPHDFAVRVRRQRQLRHSRPPHLTARS